MGTYTPNQRFYLIGTDELVNVEQDLNYNWQRADDRIKPLVEYQTTDVLSVYNSSLPKDTGFKWYKTYSNSIWHWRDGSIYEDPNAAIDNWTTSGLSFETGYGSYDEDVNRISYSVFNNFVRWRGRLALTSGGELPKNTTVNFVTPPTSILPVRQKYFTVYGGNSTADFQCFRIYIPNDTAVDLRMEFCGYGGNASSSGERYISLNDIFYALNDV